MKHNHKCLEEQHYKAQERIQFMLKGKNGPEYIKDLSSLYPCDQCTKNFLTMNQLKSHQQRKHVVIREKHDLSDENEKNVILATHEEKELSSLQSNQKEESQSINNNNNNNDNDNSSNCIVCTQRTESKSNSRSVAIQCEVNIEQKNHNDITVEIIPNGNIYFRLQYK